MQPAGRHRTLTPQTQMDFYTALEHPPMPVPTMLAFDGVAGLGKSTALKILAGEGHQVGPTHPIRKVHIGLA